MKLLVYDNTWNSFLSAVFAAFSAKCEATLVRSVKYGGATLFETEFVHETAEHAARVEAGMRRLSRDLPETVYRVWLTEFDGIEEAIIQTLKLGFRMKASPLSQRQHDCVKRTMDALRHIEFEAQRFRGYVRFVRAGDDLYAADIAPDCNILPLLASHFHERFRNQRTIIRDTVRRLALVSDRSGWEIIELAESQMKALPAECEFENYWRKYFQTISNKSRENRDLQRQFVPLKYRANLTEFNHDGSGGTDVIIVE